MGQKLLSLSPATDKMQIKSKLGDELKKKLSKFQGKPIKITEVPKKKLPISKKKPKKKEIKLTPKQKKFADKYLETGNGTRSALEAYDTKDYNTAHAIAGENLQKPTIKAYLDDKGDEAGAVLRELMNKGLEEPTRLGAAKFIYEHAHGKATQKVETKRDDKQLSLLSFVHKLAEPGVPGSR